MDNTVWNQWSDDNTELALSLGFPLLRGNLGEISPSSSSSDDDDDNDRDQADMGARRAKKIKRDFARQRLTKMWERWASEGRHAFLADDEEEEEDEEEDERRRGRVGKKGGGLTSRESSYVKRDSSDDD